MKSKNVFYGWYVAISCSLIYFFVNSMTLFVPQNLFPTFIEEFSLNREQASLTVRNTLLFAAAKSRVFRTVRLACSRLRENSSINVGNRF